MLHQRGVMFYIYLLEVAASNPTTLTEALPDFSQSIQTKTGDSAVTLNNLYLTSSPIHVREHLKPSNPTEPF